MLKISCRRSFARAMAARALLAVWTGLLALGRPARASAVPSATRRPGAADEAEPGQGVSFDGHVVELETGKSVAVPRFIVERLVRCADARSMPPWAGESTIRTDADGRFRLTFPPEQVADRRLLDHAARDPARVHTAEVLGDRSRLADSRSGDG